MGPISVGVLRQAGLRLQRRFPSLRARWESGGEDRFPTGLQFCPPDPQGFRVEEIRAHGTAGGGEAAFLDTLVEEQLNRVFDVGTESLCRVLWVPNRTEGGFVLLRISEAVTDTFSLVRLYRGLLDECARVLRGPTRYDPTHLDTEPIPSSVLDFAPFRAQAWLSAGARRLSQLLVPRGAIAMLQGATADPTMTLNAATRCLGLDGDPEGHAALLRRLHGSNLELRDLVAASAQRAYFDEFGLGSGAASVLSLEFELRRELKGRTEPSLIGLLSGIALLSEPVKDGSTLRDHAKALQHRAVRSLRRGTPWSPHFELEQLVAAHGPPIARELAEVALRSVPAALHVGAIVDALPLRFGPLVLGRVRMARRASLRSAPFALWVCRKEDRLHYCLTCRDEPELVERGRSMLGQIRYWTEQTDNVGA
jgi:hypothetical protein